MCVSTASDRTASSRGIRGYWGVYMCICMEPGGAQLVTKGGPSVDNFGCNALPDNSLASSSTTPLSNSIGDQTAHLWSLCVFLVSLESEWDPFWFLWSPFGFHVGTLGLRFA